MKAFFEAARPGAPGASERDPEAEQLRRALDARRAQIEERLHELVPPIEREPQAVHEAMRWSLFAGGKRLRPLLLMLIGEACGAPPELLWRAACAFEMLHTYSLIHDDLPAMDDDDLRRGLPTCHVKFGEAMAILAGDALQALAFQVIAEDENLPPATRVRALAELARAAGTPDGMVAGQVEDLRAESRQITGAELEAIHRRKTGALIAAAARCGALIAGADDARVESVTRYAAALGLLFQITDDLLDVIATAEDLGKTPGKDARAAKATYPALYGLASARERAQSVYNAALTALDALRPHPTGPLQTLARLILERRA